MSRKLSALRARFAEPIPIDTTLAGGASAPFRKSTMTRRNLMSAVALPIAVLATPSIADPHLDAELIALGQQFKNLEIAAKDAGKRAKDLYDLWRTQSPDVSDTLIIRISDVPLFGPRLYSRSESNFSESFIVGAVYTHPIIEVLRRPFQVAYHCPVAEMRNPAQGGHRFRRKADSIPVIADSR